MHYKNILDYCSDSEAEINFQAVPYDEHNNYKDTNKSNVFADNGSWHGYYLPKKKHLSSFAGPLVLSQEIPVNIGPYSNKLIIKYNDENINFHDAKKEVFSQPGKLVLSYEFEDFIINKKLIFASNRTAFIETTITNKTTKKIDLGISIEGSVYLKVKTKSSGNSADDTQFWFKYFNNISEKENAIEILFNPIINKSIEEKFIIEYSNKIKNFETLEKDNELIYKSDFGSFTIEAKGILELSSFESFLFEKEKNVCRFNEGKDYFLNNYNRWNKYIKNVLKVSKASKYELLTIKSLQTLVSNWRSPAGVIKKNFIIPSITYQDFIGAWSWDTWKIVVGIAQFDTKLAQETFEVMFDFQIQSNDSVRPNDVGMIPDCIFFNYSPARGGVGPNWNERNSKPPIAAWAALEIYKISRDLNFLEQIYPKIVAYNDWWNNNRSLNKDCVLQYGGTVDEQNDFSKESSIVEAAAWESGMDNAPRFDWDRAKVEKVFSNDNLIGYVIDQISVDLNSFNYLDFVSLSQIAYFLSNNSDAMKYQEKAETVKEFINKYMYNNSTKFYYDIKSSDKRQVVDYGKGMEGILPIFAGVATDDIAKEIIENIHENNFNQVVPFPSVSVNNERFSELDYWRGPVWLDQLYFGLKGVKNYGYNEFAKELASKALKNMEGLLGNATIRENYSALTGKGLSTTNFSWSASLLLMILKEVINN